VASLLSLLRVKARTVSAGSRRGARSASRRTGSIRRPKSRRIRHLRLLATGVASVHGLNQEPLWTEKHDEPLPKGVAAITGKTLAAGVAKALTDTSGY
jgi:hypothetical protein